MKKKVVMAALMLSMLTVCNTGKVCAASVNQDVTDNIGTEITFEYKNDPTYTVTIPSELKLANNGVPMQIVAEDVANLDNQKVSVTIAGTDKYRNQMVLEGQRETAPKNASLRYQIIKEDDTVIETTGGIDQVNGVELASFTENGTATLNVRPVLVASTAKGVTYTGSITYGIELVTLE